MHVSLDAYMCMNCIMYVVMYGRAFVCMIICTTHGHGCMYTCMHMYIHMYIHVYGCTVCVHMCAYVCIHMYVMIYNVRVCVMLPCVCVCMHYHLIDYPEDCLWP